jgi:hypothetical protein
MEPLLTLKTKNIPKYFSLLVYGVPFTLVLVGALIYEGEPNFYKKLLLAFVLLTYYLSYLAIFDFNTMNYIKEYHTIEVFKDHLLINSQEKLDLRDICFERIIFFTPTWGRRLLSPEYDAGYIKDTHGKLLYKIYFKVIWHTVLDSSAYDFKELIDKLKSRLAADDKGREMVVRLKQKENESRANF